MFCKESVLRNFTKFTGKQLRQSLFFNKVVFCKVTQMCSVKKVFLEISQNSQENTSARVFFNKVASLRPATLSKKKRFWHRRFSVNFVKFLRTPFYIEHLWWLLLGFTSNIFELHEPKTGGKRKV